MFFSYDSHPTFCPEPSVRDIENQKTYQSSVSNDDAKEPFVGLIVGKVYEKRLS